MLKKLLAASLALAALVAVPAAVAQPVTRQHQAQYRQLYRQAAARFGQRAPGCDLFRSCRERATDARVVASIGVLERMFAPPPAPAAATVAPVAYQAPSPPVEQGVQAVTSAVTAAAQTAGGGGYGNVPGVPGSFAACVAQRESTDGAGSSDIYGILPMNGYYAGMSVAAQQTLFSQLYAAHGNSPWTPYDHC